MIVAFHPCLCSQSDISNIYPTARTVLAAPKAGNLEGHLEKAEPEMVAAADGVRPSPLLNVAPTYTLLPSRMFDTARLFPYSGKTHYKVQDLLEEVE